MNRNYDPNESFGESSPPAVAPKSASPVESLLPASKSAAGPHRAPAHAAYDPNASLMVVAPDVAATKSGRRQDYDPNESMMRGLPEAPASAPRHGHVAGGYDPNDSRIAVAPAMGGGVRSGNRQYDPNETLSGVVSAAGKALAKVAAQKYDPNETLSVPAGAKKGPAKSVATTTKGKKKKTERRGYDPNVTAEPEAGKTKEETKAVAASAAKTKAQQVDESMGEQREK